MNKSKVEDDKLTKLIKDLIEINNAYDIYKAANIIPACDILQQLAMNRISEFGTDSIDGELP